MKHLLSAFSLYYIILFKVRFNSIQFYLGKFVSCLSVKFSLMLTVPYFSRNHYNTISIP